MQSSARRVLIDELKIAHAMERQACDTLAVQQNRMSAEPDLARRMGEHLSESRRQMERIETCLKGLGAEPSPLRDVSQRVIGGLQMAYHAAADGEVLRAMYATFAFEGQEIATYHGLVAMARNVGEEKIAELCQQSLVEEQDMALFLEERLDEVAVRHLQRAVARLDRKR